MNDMSELRKIMFDTLRGLADKEAPMEIERAKAICDAGQVLINTAKVECDFIRVRGGRGTGFIADGERGQDALTETTETRTGEKTVTRSPDGRVITRHTMR